MRNAKNITFCSECRHTGAPCDAGLTLLWHLAGAVAAAADLVGPSFSVSGRATVTGCARTCVLGYVATRDDVWLFGDIAGEDDPLDLVDLAHSCCDGQAWPGTVKRAPAALARLQALGPGLQ